MLGMRWLPDISSNRRVAPHPFFCLPPEEARNPRWVSHPDLFSPAFSRVLPASRALRAHRRARIPQPHLRDRGQLVLALVFDLDSSWTSPAPLEDSDLALERALQPFRERV